MQVLPPTCRGCLQVLLVTTAAIGGFVKTLAVIIATFFIELNGHNQVVRLEAKFKVLQEQGRQVSAGAAAGDYR